MSFENTLQLRSNSVEFLCFDFCLIACFDFMFFYVMCCFGVINDGWITWKWDRIQIKLKTFYLKTISFQVIHPSFITFITKRKQ